MLRRLSILVGTALVLWTGTVHAQDTTPAAGTVTGTWVLSWEGPRGPATMMLELVVDGQTLSGRMETRGGWRDIKDGNATPEGVAFALEMGRDDRTFRMEFKGALAPSGELKGTVTSPRGDNLPWTATRTK